MTMLRKLWPKTLTAQMMVLVVLVVVVAMCLNLWVLSRAHERALLLVSERHQAKQFASMVLLLENTPEELHRKVIRAWRHPGRYVGFKESPHIAPGRSSAELRMQEEALEYLGEGYRDRLRVKIDPAKRGKVSRDSDDWEWAREQRDHRKGRRLAPVEYLVLTAQLDNGHWLISKTGSPGVSPLAALQTLIALALVAILLLAAVFWQMGRITRPLRRLRVAASALGRGEKVEPITADGPQDVRETVQAFNLMNERVDRFVRERTRMLAAISHDLRTPMTSMRLRLEMMADSEERDKLIASLDEMQQMAEAALDFVKQTGDREPLQAVDVNALLQSLCEDFADTGAEVDYEECEPVTLRCRLVSLKRALRNLMENAIKYAGATQVRCRKEADRLIIEVSDQGPGIPEDQLDRVFDPFFRLESSRNRDTGGTGLGLAIARQIVQAHGGSITLQNTRPGLKAVVSIPL